MASMATEDKVQWRKTKPIGFVIAEVVGLHVEQCESVSWHRLLNASQGLPPTATVQQGCSCTALWGNILMYADKLGPVARGLVVDWVYSRVLTGGSCHLHHQHVDLYSLQRTSLVVSNFCVNSNVFCILNHHHTRAQVQGSPPAHFWTLISCHFSKSKTSHLNDKDVFCRMGVVWLIAFPSHWMGTGTQWRNTAIQMLFFFSRPFRICHSKTTLLAAEPSSAADVQPG